MAAFFLPTPRRQTAALMAVVVAVVVTAVVEMAAAGAISANTHRVTHRLLRRGQHLREFGNRVRCLARHRCGTNLRDFLWSNGGRVIAE